MSLTIGNCFVLNLRICNDWYVKAIVPNVRSKINNSWHTIALNICNFIIDAVVQTLGIWRRGVTHECWCHLHACTCVIAPLHNTPPLLNNELPCLCTCVIASLCNTSPTKNCHVTALVQYRIANSTILIHCYIFALVLCLWKMRCTKWVRQGTALQKWPQQWRQPVSSPGE